MPESVLQQDPEVPVVPTEHPVVEGLCVVGICSSGKEQPGDVSSGGMSRLPAWTRLAFAEAQRQDGERGRQVLPQETRVGIGPGVEEDVRRR